MALNEFEIFQNKAIGAHAIWEFSKSYKMHNSDSFSPTLLMAMPLLPLVFNRRVVNGIKERNFKEGSLLRALDENKDLFSGLQERMEDMGKLTLESIYLSAVVGLIIFDRDENIIIPKAKNLPMKLKENLDKNRDYIDIINASRRIGAWFGQFSQSEIFLYFNLQF
jgi:hypothetical protein